MQFIPKNDDGLAPLHRLTRRALVAATLVTAIGGCAIAGKDVAADIAVVPPGKGIAVLSTTADELSLSFSTRLMLVDGASRQKYDKVVIFMDAKLGITYNFPDTNTSVRSLTLPAGDYFLVPVSGNPMMRTIKTPVFKFTVVPGAVQYLGTVRIAHARLTLENANRERDMAFFLGKNPALRGAPMAASPLAFDRYLSPETGEQFEIKGTIWDAPQ